MEARANNRNRVVGLKLYSNNEPARELSDIVSAGYLDHEVEKRVRAVLEENKRLKDYNVFLKNENRTLSGRLTALRDVQMDAYQQYVWNKENGRDPERVNRIVYAAGCCMVFPMTVMFLILTGVL